MRDGLPILLVGLALGLTACARGAPCPAPDLELGRLIIGFAQPLPSAPPPELSVIVAPGDTIALHLERALSGGYFRYRTPPLPASRLHAVLRTLQRRGDIAHVELDTRRGVR